MQTQQQILETSYQWATNVIVKQQRFLPFGLMWAAYHWKSNGLNKEGLKLLLDTMQGTLTEHQSTKTNGEALLIEGNNLITLKSI